MSGINVNPGGTTPPGTVPPGTTPPKTTPSAPAAPKVDPVIAEKESLFQSIYVKLWGEPATEAYLKAAANSGENTWEFTARERAKPEWADTKAYKDQAQSIADLLTQLGLGRGRRG